MPSVQVNGPYTAKQFEILEGSTLTAAVGLTASKYDVAVTTLAPYDKVRHAKEALITVEAADLRWTCDGTTPTLTSGTGAGHIAGNGDAILLSGYDMIKNFKAINAVASNGVRMQVTYFFD